MPGMELIVPGLPGLRYPSVSGASEIYVTMIELVASLNKMAQTIEEYEQETGNHVRADDAFRKVAKIWEDSLVRRLGGNQLGGDEDDRRV